MTADLHVHSTASDGTLSPNELVGLAISRGLSVLAIADHDTVGGLDEALQAAENTSLRLIPAVELSAIDEDGNDIHVLGYFIDWHDLHFLAHLADLRDARLARARTMVAALNDAGYAVSVDDVLAISDGGAVGRTHVARALVAAGHATDVSDAFRRFIGREGPFYVPKDRRSPDQVIAIIRDAGGIPVVAHPAVSGVESLIERLVEHGLLGIEAYHADHTPEQRERLASLAARLGLLATGGTDFHGPSAPNPALGTPTVPDAAVDALLAAGETR